MARKPKQVNAEINSKKSNNLSGNKENNYDANLSKTREFDIEEEVKRMYNENKNIFKGKTILFPCNDVNGAFYNVFVKYGDMFGYDKCIFVNYKNNKKYTDVVFYTKKDNGKYIEHRIDENYMKENGIKWNGDVFNDCYLNKRLWDETDIVITNIGGDYEVAERDRKNIWKNIVNEEFPKLDKETKKVLVNRFALGDKSVRITKIYNKYPSEKEHIISFNENKVNEKKKEINNDNRFVKLIKKCFRMNKQFLIVGNQNAISYKEIFPLVKDNELWIGVNHPKEFVQPDGTTKNFGNISWYTNLGHNKRNNGLELTKTYSNEYYTMYDNYNGIDVSKVCEIPKDYYGVMGVPITFLDKYNPNQFEIIGIPEGDSGKELGLEPFPRELKKLNPNLRDGQLYYIDDNGIPQKPYARILIRRKR